MLHHIAHGPGIGLDVCGKKAGLVKPSRYLGEVSHARPQRGDAAAQGKDVVDFDADKAIRVLEVTRPVYVDNDVLILRALTDAFFVWERAAFELE